MANLYFFNKLEITICQRNFKVKIKLEIPILMVIILLQLCSN